MKCNRCGKVNAAGAVNCQACGAPLSATATNGFAATMGTQDQPGLPAWLETLRAGERPVTSASNQGTNFPTADLVSEDALPNWMKSSRNETQNVTGATPPISVVRPTGPVPQVSQETAFPAQGLDAQSLIDMQSLPGWMQEGQGSGAQRPENGIAASSLVQPDEVPSWMKTLGQPMGSERPASAPSSPSMSSPFSASDAAAKPSTSASGFSARDLVDQQSLPPWISQLGGSNQKPAPSDRSPMRPSQPAAPTSGSDLFASNQIASRNENPASGFSAHDLVDPQSLPSWMAQQGGKSGQVTASAPLNNTPDIPASPTSFRDNGISASSLLDSSSLPAWMQEAGLSSSGTAQRSQTAQSPFAQPPRQEPAQSQGPSAPINGLSASSFIDNSSVPEWMRSIGGQTGQTGSPASSRPMPTPPPSFQGQAPYNTPVAGPPRVENVRVPNRPRTEISSSETSEMAATVFASMLGVASATPTYSSRSQMGQPGSNASMSGNLSQQGQPGVNAGGIPSTSSSQLPPLPQQSSPYAGQSMSGMSNMGVAGPGSYSGNLNNIGSQSPANSYSGLPGQNIPGSQMGQSGSYSPYQSQTNPYDNGMQGMQGNYPGLQNQNRSGSMSGNLNSMQSNASLSGQYSSNTNMNNVPQGFTSPRTPDGTMDQKNSKKRGLFGAFLDWLSR